MAASSPVSFRDNQSVVRDFQNQLVHRWRDRALPGVETRLTPVNFGKEGMFAGSALKKAMCAPLAGPSGLGHFPQDVGIPFGHLEQGFGGAARWLRPCSHSYNVRTDTPSRAANRACDSPECCRAAMIGEYTTVPRPAFIWRIG